MSGPFEGSVNVRLLAGTLVGTLVSLALVLLIADRFFPLSLDSADRRAGARVFDENCSGCHAIEPAAADKMGPTLARIGVLAAERRPGYDALDYIVESIAHPDAWRQPDASGHMPAGTLAGVPESRARDLLAYLASRGTEQIDYQALLSIDLAEAVAPLPGKPPVEMATLEHGWQLFSERYGCTGCHSVFGTPGSDWIAPDLSNAYQMSDEYLRESIRHPDRMIVPGYRRAVVTDRDGTVHAGRLLSEHDERGVTLLVLDSNGHRDTVRLPPEEIAEIERSDDSPMPAYTLPPDEEKALLEFLRFVRGQVS